MTKIILVAAPANDSCQVSEPLTVLKSDTRGKKREALRSGNATLYLASSSSERAASIPHQDELTSSSLSLSSPQHTNTTNQFFTQLVITSTHKHNNQFFTQLVITSTHKHNNQFFTQLVITSTHKPVLHSACHHLNTQTQQPVLHSTCHHQPALHSTCHHLNTQTSSSLSLSSP